MQSPSVNSRYGARLAATPSLREIATRNPSCGCVVKRTGKPAVRANCSTLCRVSSVEPSSVTTTSKRPLTPSCSAIDCKARSTCPGR